MTIVLRHHVLPVVACLCIAVSSCTMCLQHYPTFERARVTEGRTLVGGVSIRAGSADAMPVGPDGYYVGVAGTSHHEFGTKGLGAWFLTSDCGGGLARAGEAGAEWDRPCLLLGAQAGYKLCIGDNRALKLGLGWPTGITGLWDVGDNWTASLGLDFQGISPGWRWDVQVGRNVCGHVVLGVLLSPWGFLNTDAWRRKLDPLAAVTLGFAVGAVGVDKFPAPCRQ